MKQGRAAIGLAVAHTLVLAAYTMPGALLPDRLRFWAQAYAGVLFHQDWRLFAPDPPACGCSLLVAHKGAGPEPLADAHDHFIWRRMTANACRFAEASMTNSDGPMPVVLARSLTTMADQRGDTTVQLQWVRSGACEGARTLPLRSPVLP